MPNIISSHLRQVNAKHIFQHEFEGSPWHWLQRVAFSHPLGSPHSTSCSEWKNCKKKRQVLGDTWAAAAPYTKDTHRHPRWETKADTVVENTLVNKRQEDVSRAIQCLCLPPWLAVSCLVVMGNQRQFGASPWRSLLLYMFSVLSIKPLAKQSGASEGHWLVSALHSTESSRALSCMSSFLRA